MPHAIMVPITVKAEKYIQIVYDGLITVFIAEEEASVPFPLSMMG